MPLGDDVGRDGPPREGVFLIASDGGTLFVASIGQVDACRSFGGARREARARADRSGGHGGNPNLVLAPNGRLVMRVASACDHCTETSRWSASIVSFDLDGSNVETHASRVRAAFGLVFVPGSSMLFATMNRRDDLGSGTTGDAPAVVRAGDDGTFPGCHGQRGSATGRAALAAEWERGSVQRVALSGVAARRSSGAAATVLSGLVHPLPVFATAGGARSVGDGSTGRIFRIVSR